MNAVTLSVLDLAPVQADVTAGDALHATTRLAQHAEELGFRRFWVAEHHNMPGIASAAPAVVLAHLAASTTRIRLGSGGVMLPNHAPLVVAEQFGTLESLHPGRIDLGIGRAPGTDPVTARALRRHADGLGAESFPRELTTLIGFFRGTDTDGIVASPGRGAEPEVWLLGSSGYSAQVAAALGLPFAFAHHIAPDNTAAAVDLYRDNFRPSETRNEPYTIVAASAICADTDDEADRLAAPRDLAFANLRSGRPQALATPDQAAGFPGSDAERHFAAQRKAGQLQGSPETVRAQAAQLLDATSPDELMLNTLVYDIDARIRSLDLTRKAING
ncbi:LLM class flavin-dependent oxidoreductase [Nocardia mangyaensis]|uniref:LLM class flavin-dependent oxidoreductase n=1 Tax=Nocardia mangyaensis TaxID=2213200 RepID=UPI002675BEF8|nr:LLM class flavin-dependent oxidoreductase [Nocardia mangyaensis]MDO3647968.1 LLM class flavin-dependent oxidoreductase [Nocardia mangyaensis]